MNWGLIEARDESEMRDIEEIRGLKLCAIGVEERGFKIVDWVFSDLKM